MSLPDRLRGIVLHFQQYFDPRIRVVRTRHATTGGAEDLRRASTNVEGFSMRNMKQILILVGMLVAAGSLSACCGPWGGGFCGGWGHHHGGGGGYGGGGPGGPGGPGHP